MLGLVQRPLSLDLGQLFPLEVDSVSALLPLREPFYLIPPVLSHDAVSSNPDFDRIDEVGEGSLAEWKDVFGRRTGVANVVDFGSLRSDEDVTARKAREVVAVAAFCEVEGHRPMSVGSGLGGDAETEGKSEGTKDVGEGVQFTDRSEKLRTGLAVFDVNVVHLVVPENG